MVRYFFIRLATTIPLLVVITSLTFLLGQYGAGDLAAYITFQKGGGRFDPDVYKALREELGIDDPALVRYGRWLINAIQGDLGRSYVRAGEPSVIYLIKRAMPVTIQLGIAALIIVAILGVPLGILAATYRNSLFDFIIVGTSTFLSSIPTFVLAPLLIYVMVLKLHVFPYVGLGWSGIFSEKTIIPALALAAGPLLGIVRYTRASVLEVLSQEYIRAAHSKGLPKWKVISRHVVKNSFIPIVTVLGLSGANLVAGSIFIEAIFNFQGFGMLAQSAIAGGDLQTSTGVLIFSALIILTINIIVDLTYGFLDPRVRYTD